MNKIYSKVRNPSMGMLAVASERARSNGRERPGLVTRRSLVVALALALAPWISHAEVCDGTFAAGMGPTAVSGSLACGAVTAATGEQATAIGNSALAIGNYSSAFGDNAKASAEDSLAIGADSEAKAGDSVALGQGSIANEANTVSIGSVGNERRMVNVADGQDAHDAVNKEQLDNVADQSASDLNDATRYLKANGAADGSDDALALGDYATALGSASFALGTGSSALGSGTSAVGDFSTAAGYDAYALGTNSLAQGAYAQALADDSVAMGSSATASAASATAIGPYASAQDARSTAVGYYASAVGQYAAAFGAGATSDGTASLAVGNFAKALADHAVSVGAGTLAQGSGSTALGGAFQAIPGVGPFHATQAYGLAAVAIGSGADAVDDYSSAIGTLSKTLGVESTAVGYEARTFDDYATALGSRAWAEGANSLAAGAESLATGDRSVALGYYTEADGANSVALGANSIADRDNTVSVGSAGAERQITHVAAGTQDTDAVNVAQLKATGLVDGNGNPLAAVTYDDVSKASVTLAGTNGTTLADVAAGTQKGEAVNVEQLQSLAATIGGGISMGADGLIGAPDFSIQGSTYFNVGDALGALDGALSGALGNIGDLDIRVTALETDVGRSGAAAGSGDGVSVGDSHAEASNDTAVGNGANVAADGSTAVGSNSNIASTATNAVAVGADSTVTAASGTAVGQGASVNADNAVALGAGSVADEANTVSVGNTNQQRRVTEVADGVNTNDAVNKGQLDGAESDAIEAAKTYADAGDKTTLNSANAYTDSKLSGMVSSDNFDAFRDSVSDQFHTVNTRLDRVGAMGSAMAGMTGAMAAAPGTDNRVSAAAGGYKGQAALAVGYAHRLPGSGAVLFGGSVAGGGESTATVGVSYGW